MAAEQLRLVKHTHGQAQVSLDAASAILELARFSVDALQYMEQAEAAGMKIAAPDVDMAALATALYAAQDCISDAQAALKA